VEVVPYDPRWPACFAAEQQALTRTLAPYLAGAIEHIGSTAVEGLWAKPVIDILVPVHDLASSRPGIALLEQQHGYHHWPYKAAIMHWLCKPSEHVRTHHVHMVPRDSVLFRERLAFRDALRSDPALRDAYVALKRELARMHPHDRDAYTDGKSSFVADAVARALG
jgi:GrpB-like predicted nucleotidyltransferase (UPF0157 family)